MTDQQKIKDAWDRAFDVDPSAFDLLKPKERDEDISDSDIANSEYARRLDEDNKRNMKIMLEGGLFEDQTGVVLEDGDHQSVRDSELYS